MNFSCETPLAPPDSLDTGRAVAGRRLWVAAWRLAEVGSPGCSVVGGLSRPRPRDPWIRVPRLHIRTEIVMTFRDR
jgi:hypothetical protein